MRRASLPAVLFALAVAAPLAAQNYPFCENTDFAKVAGQFTSPQKYTVSWQPVPGAYIYMIEETHASTAAANRVVRTISTIATSIDISHEAINDVTYQYRILAVGPMCNIISPQVKTFADPVLRNALRRGIVPIAGSARGANGADFKTYLKLEGPSLRGRIIFHPANRVASDNDPSIPYDTTMKSEWDDVVAAMGQSGIGSLSIVPDAGEVGQLPRATVRLYNVAANGIYGTNAELYPAAGFLAADEPGQRVDVPADGNFRPNVGVRAIIAGSVRGFAVTKEGLQKKVIERSFAAGEVVFGAPQAVYGVALDPGESLVLTFSRGIVPFYTLTDNRTNDPFLYVQGAERTDIVDEYVK